MRIAILTLATDNIRAYADYGLLNKRAYAAAHGYDFHVYEAPLDDERAPAWSKIKIIERHLPYYDWVFWSDADSLIMNHRRKLEEFIELAAGFDMVLTPGPRDRYNTGQWLVRSCEWSAAVLAQIWVNALETDWWLRKNPWEQQALIDLVNRTPEYAGHIKRVPTRSLNARPESAYLDMHGDLPGIEYEEGDFIVHFYHTKEFDSRVRGMADYFARCAGGEPVRRQIERAEC